MGLTFFLKRASLLQWTWLSRYVKDCLRPTPRPRSTPHCSDHTKPLAHVRGLLLDDSVRFAHTCFALQTQRVFYCAAPIKLHCCFAIPKLPNIRDQARSPTRYTLTGAYYYDTHNGGTTSSPAPAEGVLAVFRAFARGSRFSIQLEVRRLWPSSLAIPSLWIVSVSSMPSSRLFMALSWLEASRSSLIDRSSAFASL